VEILLRFEVYERPLINPLRRKSTRCCG